MDGKVAIVTGGGSGIGRASARLLAQHRATVVVADRNGRSADLVSSEITKAGGTAFPVCVNIADHGEAQGLVDQTISNLGIVDILLHCAGICPRKPLLETSAEEWRQVLSVNLDGTFYVAQSVGKAMAKRGSGTIILLASDVAAHGTADYAPYAVSKGGVITLTKSLAIALGKFGVTVNALNPGVTDTPLARHAIPAWEQRRAYDVLGRFSTPEEIAELVLFMAGRGGRFMTGQIISVRMRSIA